MAGASEDTPFKSALIDDHVKQIVVFVDTLEFHLETGETLTTPWKNTAKRDLWAYRRKIANTIQIQHNNEVIA